MKRNFLNLVMGTALTLTMANTAIAMKTASDFEDECPTKRIKLNEEKKTETAETLVAGYLTLQDLFSLEVTSKAAHASLQNAPQYQALIEGWEDRIPNYSKKSYKESFMYLNTEIPEYKVHLANLWFNFFPLEGVNLKLSHYWGMADLREIPKLLGYLNSIYDHYLNRASRQSEFACSATLGQAITFSKVDGSQTNHMRLDALNVIYQNVDGFSADQRNTARYNWIEHTVKHALVDPTTPPLPYTADRARADYEMLLDDEYTPIHIKMSVLYHIGELDIKGLGLNQSDREAAEEKFLTVLANPKTHPFTKILAHKYLDFISQRGK